MGKSHAVYEILFVAQLGDLISLGANIIKGSRSGILMSAAGFIPFGSQFKLVAKTSTIDRAVCHKRKLQTLQNSALG